MSARRLLAPAPEGPLAPRGRPTISVVIPYFKAADVVAEAVDSVLAQTRAPEQIVICDDGSPDDLDAALGPRRAHVTIVRKENGGAASAFNAGAAVATGEFVAQLDADDTFMPERVAAISDAIVARPDLDVIATDALIELDGEPLVTFRAATPFETEHQRRAVVRECFFAWPAIRRSRLLAVGGYDERFRATSDWAGFIRLVLDGARVGMVDEPLYRWRLTAGSISSDGAFNAEEEVRLLQETKRAYALAADELAVLEESIARNRRRGLLLRAKESLSDGRPDARARARAVAVERGLPVATRAKAAVAVLSPVLARHALRASFAGGSLERRFGAQLAAR